MHFLSLELQRHVSQGKGAPAFELLAVRLMFKRSLNSPSHLQDERKQALVMHSSPPERHGEEGREMVKGEEMTGKEDRKQRDQAFQNLGTSFLHRFVLIIVNLQSDKNFYHTQS